MTSSDIQVVSCFLNSSFLCLLFFTLFLCGFDHKMAEKRWTKDCLFFVFSTVIPRKYSDSLT